MVTNLDSDAAEEVGNKVQNLLSPNSTTYLSTQGIRTTLDTEVVTKIESYDNFNARFLGEVGKPADNSPAWTEDEPTKISLEDQSVFGVTRQVVKFLDDIATSGVGAEIALITADWTNINSFGASFGGTIRLDSTDDGGFFMGLQDNDVDKRYGMLASNSGGFLRLDAADAGDPFDVIMDGLAGRPKVLFDEWFKLEVVIPVGLGLADVFVNGELLSEKLLFVTNSGGSGSKIIINSGSSAATDRTFYADNYGVTIYKESATKTISSTLMNATSFIVLIPPGKRDYTIQLPAGITRNKGDRFSVLAENVDGTVKLTTNPLDPLITFEGLKTIIKKVEQVIVLRYINTIDAANNYEFDHQHPTRKIQIDGTLEKPGDVNYNTILDVLEIKGKDTTLQAGQEFHIPVINKTGGTLNEGDVVRINGHDATSDRVTVTKSLADNLVNAQVDGVCTTTMVNNEEGKITVLGRVNNLDTSSFSGGDLLFLSSTVAGAFTTTEPVLISQHIGHVGKINATTGYVEVDIGQLDVSIVALLSSSIDQTYTANVSKAINFNKNNLLRGVSHSESVDNEEITIDNAGNYYFTIEPQYTRTAGGGVDVLNMYVQISTDGGSTFVNIANSNIKVSISSSGQEAVTALTQTFSADIGDILRIMIQVEDADLKLDSFIGFGSGANLVPATPSVIGNLHRIGN